MARRAGEGLDALRAALERAAARLGAAARAGALRLHVDRSFTIRGAGTVVTGTLWSGSAGRGDEVLILPAGTPARVRSVQVHDEPVERADAGQRVALNLTGVARDEVARGDVSWPARGAAVPSYRVDAALEWATPDARPDGGARVARPPRHARDRRAARGARRALLPAAPGAPLVPARGDRLVIRSLAPPDTLGGGVVLDPAPAATARAATCSPGSRAWSAGSRSPPPPGAAAPAAAARRSHRSPRRARARGAPARRRPRAAARLRAAGRRARRTARAGRVARLGRGMHIHREALAAVERRVAELIERDGEVTIASLRDELGTSRKYAQALLEALDAARITLRVGDGGCCGASSRLAALRALRARPILSRVKS